MVFGSVTNVELVIVVAFDTDFEIPYTL